MIFDHYKNGLKETIQDQICQPWDEMKKMNKNCI